MILFTFVHLRFLLAMGLSSVISVTLLAGTVKILVTLIPVVRVVYGQLQRSMFYVCVTVYY